MKIYNTLTKKKEEFEPLEKNKVKRYLVIQVIRIINK